MGRKGWVTGGSGGSFDGRAGGSLPEVRLRGRANMIAGSPRPRPPVDCMSAPFLQQRLEFPFPARDPHAGLPLANGTLGVLLWGEGGTVRLTVNRADYWDRQGALEFGPEATAERLRAWLEAGDAARVREVFEGKTGEEPRPRPTRLPMGRVELRLPPDWRVAGGGLYLQTGEAELELAGHTEGARAKLRAVVLRDRPVLCLRVTGLDGTEVRVAGCPAGTPEVLEAFRRRGLPRAQPFDLDEFGGWVQERPQEPAMCAAWLRHATPGGLLLYLTSAYGEHPAAARREALQALEAARAEGYTPATLRTFGAWRRWWEQAAEVYLPDPTLELLYYLGMYRLAALSGPGAPAITLQGPWVEDHRLPPWSGDYHFNVNVQECYWPCFAGNHPEALAPLVRLLREWEPRLRAHARTFAGVDDGLLLPHATDDRGRAIGGFWPGLADPSNAAWTGHLLWLYYRHTGDREFLRATAYPFLRGALRVYEALLEEDGRQLSLPVSVSPEYGGSGGYRPEGTRGAAWGRNASFQLAALRFLLRALREAAGVLELEEPRLSRWAEIEARLPLGAIGGTAEAPELLVWEGQPLAESHRHHSHLAAIYPFGLLDCAGSELHRRLAHHSLRRLAAMGTGGWTGWCLPWAAILHARQGHGVTAALLLECFRRLFMGPGHATTHDARHPGFTAFTQRPDVMQVEAGLGAAAAVLELLLHTSEGVLRVFPAVPEGWDTARFERVRAEGAFLVSAERRGGRTCRVEIRSEAGLPLRLANPWSDAAVLIRRGASPPYRTRGRVLELDTEPGELLVFEPAAP